MIQTKKILLKTELENKFLIKRDNKSLNNSIQ